MARKDTFWQDLELPFQKEDLDDVEIVNVVHALLVLANAGQWMTYCAKRAEEISREIAEITVEREEHMRALRKLRRKILSKHLDQYKAGYTEEVRDAFIQKRAEELGRDEDLDTIEASVEAADQEIARRQPALNFLKGRMKAIDNRIELCTEFINFYKHEDRAQRAQR